MLCLPYAGKGASLYHGWALTLPAEVEVCPVQLPGREDRLLDPPFIRLVPLVQALVEALRPVLNKPFGVFGHSMGALLAFELARELRRQHLPGPGRLYVSACLAPHLLNLQRPLHRLPDTDLLAELHALDSAPDEALDRELRPLLLPTLRADLAICETHRYTAGLPLDCPIIAFGGDGDPRVSSEQLEAWQAHTTAALNVRMLPGGHFFFHSARDSLLQILAWDLHQFLRQIEATPELPS